LNAFDTKSFAYRDLHGIDRWEEFTPVFGSLTVVGDTSYSGRYRIVGRSLQFQVQFSAATSIASTAGTDYFTLPAAAKGLAGMAVMLNKTTNIAVGVCVIDVANSRCYLPTQGASGNVFLLAGHYEIGD
jgi:hypothetical protein